MNLAPITAITNMITDSMRLKDVIGTATPPKLNNGAKLCLSFFTKNGCWSNCKQAGTHTAILQPEEIQRVQQFLTRRLSLLQARQPAQSGASQVTPGPARIPGPSIGSATVVLCTNAGCTPMTPRPWIIMGET